MRRSRKRQADVNDVIRRIVRNIRNRNLVEDLVDKVKTYDKTKNNNDDLDGHDARLLYDDVDFDETEQLSKKRKLDVEWSNHAKYRSELRDIDHDDVNDDIVERMRQVLKDPKKKKRNKVKMKEPGTGTMVVDYNLEKKPSEADVVTVWASDMPRISYRPKDSAEAHYYNNKIYLSDKFYNLRTDGEKNHVLFHELGHWFRDKHIDLSEIMGWEEGENFFIYGRRNSDEGFAEAFATYFTDRGHLKRNYPEQYERMKSYVGGKESKYKNWVNGIDFEEVRGIYARIDAMAINIALDN